MKQGIVGLFLTFALAAVAAAAEPSAPVDRMQWAELPALPVPMSGQFVGDAGGVLVTAGGTNWPVSPYQGGTKQWFDSTFVLRSNASAWTPGPTLATPVAYGVAASHDGALVCCGGSDGKQHSAHVFRLRWSNSQLSVESLPDLPKPCAYAGGAFIGSTMYVAGGQEAVTSTTALHTFWAMDLAAPTPVWRELEPWPGPARILPVVVAQGGNLYVFSGADLAPGPNNEPDRTYLTDGYQYTPPGPGVLKPGWVPVSGPPRPLVAAPAVAYGQTHILTFSGDDGVLEDQIKELGDNHPGFPKDVLAYHTITDTWAVFGSIPESLVTTQAVMWQGRVVVAGGEDRPGHRSASALSGTIGVTHRGLATIDYGVIVLYFAVLIAMGFYFSKRERTTDDFFLGGKRIPWWAAGLSIYGTMLSAITFLAVPAESYSGNWIFLVGNLSLLLVGPLVVFFYLPFYRGAGITTAYEYLERRFSVAVRLFGSAAFMLFQLGRIGIVILLPAITLSAATGIDVYVSILAMGILCTLYTVLGGIEAVIWTDVLQVIILLGGAIIALVMVIGSVEGGFPMVLHMGAEADKFRVFNWGWDFTAKVFWVVFLGRILESVIPYTSDQTVVQRYLTTATTRDASKSVWLAMSFSIPNAFVFFGLGTALFAFYKEHPQLLDPNLKTDAIFPLFIVQQMPVGVSGLVIAAVFAAAMSSLDSSMNSVAAVVVTDFYQRFSRGASEASALLLARVVTVLIGVLGTLSAAFMAWSGVESIWQHYMKLIGLFGGALCGVFMLGIFTKRATGTGALVGAATGALVLFYVQQHTSINFLLYSTIGIGTCLLAGYMASLVLGRAPSDLTGLCWWMRRKGSPE